jgi:hypothetical protein
LDIPGVGECPDGGLWKTNPVGLVNPEIEAIAPLTEEPLIVSVGTGSTEEKDIPSTASGSRDRKDRCSTRLLRLLRAGCIIQLLRAGYKFLDGKK